MASGKNHKLQMRLKIADCMIAAAISGCDDNLIGASVGAEHVDSIIGRCFDFLEQKGCERKILLIMLNFAKTLNDDEKLFSPPEARFVKTLTKNMRKLAAQITSVDGSGFMTFLNRKETAEFRSQNGEWPGTDWSHYLPFLALPKWLEKLAAVYEAYLRLASDKILPKKSGLRRVARASLAIYVKYATGKPYYRHVLDLLGFAGLETENISESQMSRELKIIESSYPETYREIRFVFERNLHPVSDQSIARMDIHIKYLVSKSGLSVEASRRLGSELLQLHRRRVADRRSLKQKRRHL